MSEEKNNNKSAFKTRNDPESSNLWTIRIPEEESDYRVEGILEDIMVGNFLKLMSDSKPQILVTQRTPSRINVKITTCMYAICKLQEIIYKDKILKVIREKEHFNYEGTKLRITSEFSSEIMQTCRVGWNIYSVEREKIPTNLEFFTLQNYNSKAYQKQDFSQIKIEEFFASWPHLQ